jgi:hypothetical protein
MRYTYKIIQDPNYVRYTLGSIIQDNDGTKWQLIKPDKWIKYTDSYIHKTKHKRIGSVIQDKNGTKRELIKPDKCINIQTHK